VLFFFFVGTGEKATERKTTRRKQTRGLRSEMPNAPEP
jgi:hypothetical protein